MKAWVEGYGCSANMAEAEQIRGFLRSHSVELAGAPESAGIAIVHSCGVKKATEFKLLKRVRALRSLLNPSATILVSGCLPKINPVLLKDEPGVVQLDSGLEKIASFLGLPPESFSPLSETVRANRFVSIVPVSTGCLSNCSFCGTKLAKGKLKSHSIESIRKRFEKDLLLGTREFWLTSQDNACYGFDLHADLPNLLESLLSLEGEFRIRIGMMSPQFVERYCDRLISLFSDSRLYRFLHLPVQSGNNRILKLMNRPYTAAQFLDLIAQLRKGIPGLSVSTDIIAGFPTETKEEFSDSVHLIETIQPDVVNISRYGLRPGTAAAELPQLVDREKTVRSRLLSRVCRNLFLARNQSLVGRTETVLVSEKAASNGWIGRTDSYKPVLLSEAVPGEFVRVRLEKAFPNFLAGSLLDESRAVPLRAPI